jgi:nucleoside-diphosphate-sugar epimerase
VRVLITGNLGYVGPIVVSHLRKSLPRAWLAGLDTGFFANCLTTPLVSPERHLGCQYFADVRRVPDDLFRGMDAVIHLAAISNDPMGKTFENVTMDVNSTATLALARKAKAAGAKAFAFASSCSVYGFAEDGARNEGSAVNPLTAYARSKVATEEGLKTIASPDFLVTCLRFATACGFSPRLRLDLVLNDFVASALALRRIDILSDGTPWRPLINVSDMARALEWAITRSRAAGGDYLVVNAGSSRWNYQVCDLAQAVQRVIPGVQVSINPNAQPDKRSYRVDFAHFERLAPNHQPMRELEESIREIKVGLESVGFADPNFRNSRFIRLNMLSALKAEGLLTEDLYWK